MTAEERDVETAREFVRLVEIMRKLRAPDGCPWDREQTHESLRPYLIEETYEVLDSIDRGRYDELKKELGDLVLHIVFHSQLAEEERLFSIADVLHEINEKLVRRHPHVFGENKLQSSEQVKVQWEKLKLEEVHKPRLLEGVPANQPALNRAYRVQEKAAGVGFDWPDVEPVWGKIHEEIKELRDEIRLGRTQNVAKELGDLLFSIVNLSRKLKVNPEDALRISVNSFMRRFGYIEDRLAEQERGAHQASLEELDLLWEEAKVKLNTES